MSKTEALAEVAQDIASCRVCTALCQSATNAVPGEGNPDAELVFVGEAPGAEEDKQGRPFVGAAGRLLTEMLETIGLGRDDVYITNVVKYRPPGNRDPLPEEIRDCWPFLEQQVAIIQPKLIILLGRHAMNLFLPDLKISQVHGQPKRKGAQVYLPLYHPAVALYNNTMKQTLLEDFAKIPKILAQIPAASTKVEQPKINLTKDKRSHEA